MNSLKDLKIARLEAKLKAKESLHEVNMAKADLKGDFAGVRGVVSTVRKISEWGKDSTVDGRDPEPSPDSLAGLGMSMAQNLSKNKVKWRTLFFPVLIWLFKSGYLERLSEIKKSNILAYLLEVVRNLRRKVKNT